MKGSPAAIPEVDRADLAATVETLAAIDRPSTSDGERAAAEWLAERFEALGCPARIEPEPAYDSFWWTLSTFSALAVLAARAARRGRRLAGFIGALVAGAGIADEISNGPRPLRRLPAANAGPRGTWWPRQVTWMRIGRSCSWPITTRPTAGRSSTPHPRRRSARPSRTSSRTPIPPSPCGHPVSRAPLLVMAGAAVRQAAGWPPWAGCSDWDRSPPCWTSRAAPRCRAPTTT